METKKLNSMVCCVLIVAIAVGAIGTLSNALSSNSKLNLNTVGGSRPHHHASFVSSNHPSQRQYQRQSLQTIFQLSAIAENTRTSSPEPCQEEGDAPQNETNSSNRSSDIPPQPLGSPPTLTVVAGPGARITSVSKGVAVEQDLLWDEPKDIYVDGEDRFVGDCETLFTGDSFNGGRFQQPDNEDNSFITEIRNEGSSDEVVGEDSAESESSTEDCSNQQEEGSSNASDESDNYTIQSTIAKSALLHRAGIAGAVRKSSRSNGRSSKARTHVNKSGKRGATGGGAMGRVLGTVRTAAAAAAAEKKVGAKSDESNTTNNSLKANLSSSTWNQAVQSAVQDMLKHQDAEIQQQSMSVNNSHAPPGTTSMGILGEVIQDELPLIPPLPGTFLFGTMGDAQRSKPRVSIRSSIPHSNDDTHIANLRLSVFSRFDEEQQRIFRSRSVEVLNVRRRRGAVVLVAEAESYNEEDAVDVSRGYHNNYQRKDQSDYPNEMQARIASGHKYGDAAVMTTSSAPSLTVKSVRGARITSTSPEVEIDVDQSLSFATIKSKENSPQSSIIGSVECSHQEFRGTMLGNSRPKGSLMYVTEVAVRPDARRCGAGIMLMRGVGEVAALRNVETIYLHVDMTNRAACALYEKCGYQYLDKTDPVYAQFTASLNLHDGAMHGRKHFIMRKNVKARGWDYPSMMKGALGLC